MIHPTMEERARTLLSNTKKLRFFRGQVYDGGADLYLRQLHQFLDDFLKEAKNDPLNPLPDKDDHARG